MNPDLKNVHEHMLRLAVGALAHANWHAHYVSDHNDLWAELSVIQAAHAAEILIKARIAQEHPLLIFDQWPRSTQVEGATELQLTHLFERGRTVQYADLPERLWAATGIQIPNVEQYQAFGRLRNALQHFAPPDVDFSSETSKFIYGVIDPFINKSWGLFAVDYNEDHAPYEYLIASLIARVVPFLVSPGAAEYSDVSHYDWPEDDDPEYCKEMRARFETALAALPPTKKKY